MVAPREPDRFDKQAREVWDKLRFNSGDVIGLIAAALRAAESSALERAAQVADAWRERSVAVAIRALIPPAAAPAAEPGKAQGAEARPFDKRGADRLADEVDVLIQRHVIDFRSPAADALLDYRSPPRTPRSDRIAELEALVAEANRQLAKLAARVAPPEGEGT